MYETDSRGQCTKNGPHCAFAHGMDDLRQPVYDCHDLERMLDGQKGSDDGSGDLLSSSLEKDMLYNEDPVWNGKFCNNFFCFFCIFGEGHLKKYRG